MAEVPVAWAGRTRPYPSDTSVAALLVRQAAARPGAVALEEGGVALSYAQVLDRTARLAGALVARGLEPGQAVATLLPRCLDLVVAQLAIVQAGGVYVPLDPADPPARREALLDQARSRFVVADTPLPGRVTLGRDAQGPPLHDPVPRGGLDPAYVMFTSGSTGRPKGVVVPHRAIARLVAANDFALLGPEETWLHLAPPAFDASTLEVWAPLLNGGRCLVVPEPMPALGRLGEIVRQGGVSAAWLTSSLFNVVVDEAPEVLAPLRQLLTGGEALSPPHVRRALQRFPALSLMNGYGPTENTTFTCCHAITLADTDRPIPIGRPILNTFAYVVDDAGRPAEVGEAGELWAGGDGVALGYLDDPARTAERFAPDPFRPGGRVYRTGDRARWRADGVLEFLGRADAQVKIRGHRIEPGEIEACLAEHSGVRRVAVVPAAHRLVAWVVPAAPAPDAAALTRFAADRLPAWMVPNRVVFLDELPLGTSGKVDRSRLVLPGAAPGGGEGLLGILAELLGEADPERSFVEQGGDSLLALALVARVQERLGAPLEPADVLAAPSLRALAGLVGPARAPSPSAPEPADAESRRPATREQASLWLEQQLGAEPAAYNEAFAWRIEGAVDRARLRAAVEGLCRRHAALRTRLVQGERGLEQHVPAPHPTPWEEEAAPPDLLQRLRAAADQPFDLARDALARALLVHLGPNDHALLLVFHHSAIDDRALATIMAEVGGAAPEVGTGEPLPPPEPTEATRTWWREHLAGACLDHGLRRPDGVVVGAPGGLVPFDLPEALASGLDRLGRAHGATPFVVHLALLAVLLARETARADVTVGTPFSRRRSASAQAAVGYHLQTLLVRTRVSGSFLDVLHQVRETALDLHRHQDIGLSELLASTRTRGEALGRLEVVFVHRPSGDPPLVLEGARSTPLDLGPRPPKFDLTVWLDRHPEGYRGRVEYRRGALVHEAATSLAEGYRVLAEAVLAHPDGPALPDHPLPASATPAEPPREEAALVEQALVDRLVDLWRAVLRRPDIGADDDFFDHGGDSLLALALLERVDRGLGRKVPISSIFEAPSPRRFAALLGRGAPTSADAAVTLRHGPGEPLICIGELQRFRVLARHLAAERTLLGLDLPPPTDDEATQAIATIALTLADRLDRLRPAGPIELMGYSVGGNVAWEMACLLSERGRTVSRLVLVDAYAPGGVRRASALRWALAHAASLARKGPVRGSRGLLRGLRRRLRWVAYRVERRDPGSPESPEASFDRHLLRALHALAAWSPRPFDGEVTFIHAERPFVGFEALDRNGGWGPLARGGLAVHVVDCDHLSVFEEPNIRDLARVVDEVIAPS